MRYFLKIVFTFVFLIAFSVRADLYTAENVEMSGTGATPVQAKNEAITMGEIKAFDQMIMVLVGENNHALIERPTDSEILDMVRDISIVTEKNTDTSYWGKMNVRFNEKAVQNLLKKNNQAYLKKAPSTYWLIPIFKQGAEARTLEDENIFYQLLKTQNKLSNTFQIILPNGDVDELIAVEHALSDEDFSDLTKIVKSSGAEKILVVEVSMSVSGNWEMKVVPYYGTENAFAGVSVQGNGRDSLLDGWYRLDQKMNQKWQNQYLSDTVEMNSYYARYAVSKVAQWNRVEKELKKLGFLENLKLQGVMPGQLLLTFNYAGSETELADRLNKSGFDWVIDSGNLGTLKRKDYNENSL